MEKDLQSSNYTLWVCVWGGGTQKLFELKMRKNSKGQEKNPFLPPPSLYSRPPLYRFCGFVHPFYSMALACLNLL